MRRSSTVMFAALAIVLGGCSTGNTPAPSADASMPSSLAIGGKAEGEVYRVDQLDRKPRPVKQVPPRYPREARANGLRGTVVVQFTVDSSGAVHDVSATDESDPAFAEAAIESVAQWQFLPGMKDGHPVSCMMTVPISFSVDRQ